MKDNNDFDFSDFRFDFESKEELIGYAQELSYEEKLAWLDFFTRI